MIESGSGGPVGAMLVAAAAAALPALRLLRDSRPPRFPPAAPLRPADGLVAALIWLFFSMVFREGAGALHGGGGGRLEVVALGASNVAFALAAIGYLRSKYGLSRRDLGFRPFRVRDDVAFPLLAYAALLPVFAALALAERLAFPEAPVQPAVRIVQGASGALEWTLLTLSTVVAAPIGEELLFRGVVLPSLRPALGGAGAAVASSLLFAAAHQGGPFLPLLGLGMLFAGLAARSGSLLPSIVAHAAHNGVVVATLWLSRGS